MRLLLLLLFTIAIQTAFAQNANSIWVFGDSAGIDFRIPANPTPIFSGMDGRGSCASISDSLGNLLFYAYTQAGGNDWNTTVKNFLNESIPGADSITGEGWYGEVVIIPKPSSNNQYYLFSIGENYPNNNGLYYTLVDMNQNGGAGEVMAQNIQINNNLMGDCLTAVKHANGRDWWVISKLSSGLTVTTFNRFYVYLITPDSIYTPIIQDLGSARDGGFQKVIFKASGDSFMLVNRVGYMGEYSFDRCNGTITLLREIFSQQFSAFSRPFSFGEYSPNGNIFYVSTYSGSSTINNLLIQYDLTSPNILANADTLDTFLAPIGVGEPKLAPDGKIYFSCAYESPAVFSYPYADTMRNYINENLSVINNPDVVGVGCNYQPFSFYLGGKRTYYGLPNNPNYELGPVAGSVCDSLTLGVRSLEVRSSEMEVYPNPFYNKVSFSFSENKNEKALLKVFDSVGRLIFSKTILQTKQELDLSFLGQGVYTVWVETKEKYFSEKIVKL